MEAGQRSEEGEELAKQLDAKAPDPNREREAARV